MKQRRKYTWRAKLGLLLSATLTPLLAAELLLRALAPVHLTSMLQAYEYDAELGTRLRSGIHLLKTTDHQQELRTNHLGTVNFQESFDGYPRLVFALGDSYTQGTGLPMDLSYPAQLDLLLNQDAQGFYVKQYGVVNLGVAALGGEQSLLVLRRWAQLLRQPEVILYLGCDNDYADDLRFQAGYRHQHLVAGNPRWGRSVALLQWLTDDWQLGLRAKLAWAQLRQARSVAALAVAPGAASSVAEQERSVLERLSVEAQARGAQLIVGWAEAGASYDWLKTWAGRQGIAFADWAPKAQSVRAAIPQLPEENPHSGGHHRGWLNRLIAEEYARQMRAKR